MTGEDDADRLRRRVLWSMPSGLFVVGSRHGDRRNLMTANWVLQIALEPKLVLVSVEHGSVTGELIAAGGSFSVSILGVGQRALVRKFVKPVRDVVLDEEGRAVELQGVPVAETPAGLPRVAEVRGWLECAVRSRWPEADGSVSHTSFIGEVTAAGEGEVEATTGDDAVEGSASAGSLAMRDTRMNYGG
jgi:flavin reductase (DIM6/NTAB) family NADH-FMN oxidoreductase RutF